MVLLLQKITMIKTRRISLLLLLTIIFVSIFSPFLRCMGCGKVWNKTQFCHIIIVPTTLFAFCLSHSIIFWYKLHCNTIIPTRNFTCYRALEFFLTREINGKVQYQYNCISNKKILPKLLSVQSLSIQTNMTKIKYRNITR